MSRARTNKRAQLVLELVASLLSLNLDKPLAIEVLILRSKLSIDLPSYHLSIGWESEYSSLPQSDY